MSAGRYAAIVLAGGFSARMRRLKPLLPLGGATAADHIIAAFRSVGADVLLVTGHRSDEVAAGISSRGVTLVRNHDYKNGMFSSVRAGIRRLKPEHRGFFVLPVDIPLVRPATLRRLMAAAAENPQNIVYPVFSGKRGHPPLVPAALAPAILNWPGGGGLKAVLRAHEGLAREVPLADGFILRDIDTPADYRDLLARFERYEIPTDEECEVILNDICRVSPERIAHSRRVAGVAVSIGRALAAAGNTVDIEAVRAAALLHDIAKGQPKHDIAGGKLLAELGFGQVGAIVGVHSDLAGGNTDVDMETLVVYLADKFVGGEKLVSIDERYHHPDFTPEVQARVRERKQVALQVKKGLEDLLGYPLERVVFPGG